MQAWVSRTPEYSILTQHLAAPRTATPYEETKSFMRDKWEAESWALNSEPRCNGGGGGGSSSGREGTKVGSMSYSINGVEGEIIYRYNDSQDKEKIEKKLRDGLDWQIADMQTRNELTLYFLMGNSLKVDVSMSGEDMAGIFNSHLIDGAEEWEFVAGLSNSEWNNVDDLDPTGGFSNTLASAITEFDNGWIYIASDYLKDGYSGNGNFYYWDGNCRTLPYCAKAMDFYMIYGHEVGHEIDKFRYNNCPIWKEFEPHFRVKNQWEANNPRKEFSDSYLYHYGGY